MTASEHEAIPQERIDRVWDRVAKTRARRRRPRWWLAAGAAAAAALVAAYYANSTAEDEVRFASGDALEGVLHGPAETELSDGTRLQLDEGASLVPIANDRNTVEWAQRAGRIRYAVERRGRRWRIDAGSAVIEVMGTEFIVERGEDATRVDVIEGVVLVRGDALPDGVVRLGANETVLVRAREAQNVGPMENPRPSEESAPPSEESAPPSEESAPPAMQEVEPSEAPARQRPAPSAHALMNDADEARRRGERAEAERLLAQAVRVGDGDSDLAALTLARSLRRRSPAEAARRYRQAVELGLPEPLRREALRAEAESIQAAGANSSAAWRAFYRAYPDESVEVLP